MQFIQDGPDIPDALLQAHEEGRVVFFCGAGISYPAGLKDFGWLVHEIYRLNGTDPSEIERGALDRGHFDATLDQLERRLPGQRVAVRSALVEALKPKLRKKGATDTHTALLRLGRTREGALRLVTTNFDRVFHVAAKRSSQPFQAYAAPMLPIPKPTRWDGLVYLHGLLPEKPDAIALNRLVVTSGDFGLAYLTERWAARFVSELFRNYVVCFVGYSINDPVLRYMMDALAADRMLGEVTQDAWAFGDCEPGFEHRKTVEWKAKGVSAILYRVPTGSRDHSALHRTLHCWADTYRDGVLGKERIVVTHALTRPAASTQEDDFVGRMLWALSDHTGLPAKRFADFNPVPPLDWLQAFANKGFGCNDLSRFGIVPREKIDRHLRFSLINRPAPCDLAPQMWLVSSGVTASQWDLPMNHLGRWLTRHLNDASLIHWIAQRGGYIHDTWRRQIEHALDRVTSLEREGNLKELEEIHSQAPNAIPGKFMQILWRLLLSNRVKSPWSDPDFYRWKSRLKRDGLNPILRLELRELLAPRVALNQPYRWGEQEDNTEVPTRLRDLVTCDLVLAADHVGAVLREMPKEEWAAALPNLFDDLQQLLRDALDLLRELGEADDLGDRSHWDLPSIIPHQQNRGFRDWVVLIELLRDSWLSILSTNSVRAAGIAEAWFEVPYPTFKRLAFFAASQGCIPPAQWVNWLLADGAWWLWYSGTMREVFRLIVQQGRTLPTPDQVRLETAVLSGPPREMYNPDLNAGQWQNVVDESVILHLAKFESSGTTLGPDATTRLMALLAAHPDWKLASNEQDEFSVWMSGTGDPDFEDQRQVDIAPRRRRDLVEWLKKTPSDRHAFHGDTWHDLCRTKLSSSLCALCDLSSNNIWPVFRWREALNVWSQEGMVLRSWRYAATLVHNMPSDTIQELASDLTRWLETVSRSIRSSEDILLNLCQRVLDLPLTADTGITMNGAPIDNPVMEAINHPIGHIAEALINVWFKRSPRDNDLLPHDLKAPFTQMCNPQIGRFRHGRVLFASNLIALFRVDPVWTELNLLPLFNWSDAAEAKAMWEGFLRSPRLYPPLMIALKSDFLESANHYTDLGEHSQQFATFLTYAALDPLQGYTLKDFRSAVRLLPQEGLEKAAQALTQALEGAADQREDYWKNRIQPFWQEVWPKSLEMVTPKISQSLALLAIAAGGEFPAALAAVSNWLTPVEHPYYLVDRLRSSGACKRFPNEALRFINAVISDQPWPPSDLKTCLSEIELADPRLAQDPQAVRIRDYLRRHNL